MASLPGKLQNHDFSKDFGMYKHINQSLIIIWLNTIIITTFHDRFPPPKPQKEKLIMFRFVEWEDPRETVSSYHGNFFFITHAIPEMCAWIERMKNIQTIMLRETMGGKKRNKSLCHAHLVFFSRCYEEITPWHFICYKLYTRNCDAKWSTRNVSL